MSSYLSHFYQEDVVYWQPPTIDYNGNQVFTSPITFKAQIEQKLKDYTLENGQTVTSKSQILCNSPQAIEGGFVFVGKLSDIPTVDLLLPYNIKGVAPVKTVQSVKLLYNRELVKVLWL